MQLCMVTGDQKSMSNSCDTDTLVGAKHDFAPLCSGTSIAVARAVGLIASDAKIVEWGDPLLQQIQISRPVHRPENRHRSYTLLVDCTAKNVIRLDGSLVFGPEDWELVFSFEHLLFVRTRAAHKLSIVEAAQRLGHIVAVTGVRTTHEPANRHSNFSAFVFLAGWCQ